MSEEWMYRRAQEERGHVSLSQLKQFAGAGYLQPFDLVRKDGSPDWLPVSSVGELTSKLTGRIVADADWQSSAPTGAAGKRNDSQFATLPRPAVVEIGGLIFDEGREREFRAKQSSGKRELWLRPLNPRIGRSRRKFRLAGFAARHRPVVTAAAIVLVSFGILGAMVDHGLRRPDRSGGDSALIASTANPSTDYHLQASPAVPASLALPAELASSALPAAPGSPAPSASTESFQRQILGEWKGVNEPMSLTFQKGRAILTTDGHFFQILPYTLNPSDGTACLHESGGKTIPLKLHKDNRLYSQSSGTDKAMVFARQ